MTHDLSPEEEKEAEEMLASLRKSPAVQDPEVHLFWLARDAGSGRVLLQDGCFALFSSEALARGFVAGTPRFAGRPVGYPAFSAGEIHRALGEQGAPAEGWFTLNPCAACGHQQSHPLSFLASPEQARMIWAIDSAARFAKISAGLRAPRENPARLLALLQWLSTHIDPEFPALQEAIRKLSDSAS